MTAVLKWIRCTVTDRAGFARDQRAWSPLADVDGFGWQCGGWSTSVPDEAHVLAMWRDIGTYRRFMEHDHDAIAGRQQHTYSGIDVELGTVRATVGDGPGDGAAGEGAVVELARCELQPDRRVSFLAEHRSTWLVTELESGAFLVATLQARAGADQTADQAVDRPVAELAEPNRPDDDIAELDRHRFTLDTAWTVIGR